MNPPVTVEQLVQAGKLRQVPVSVLDAESTTLGNEESNRQLGRTIDGSPRTMCVHHCGCNSFCLVTAKHRLNQALWGIVFGYAIPGHRLLPRTHVWVTDGSANFDPTWARWQECDILRTRYFALTEPIQWEKTEGASEFHGRVIDKLDLLAVSWDLRLYRGYTDNPEDGFKE